MQKKNLGIVLLGVLVYLPVHSMQTAYNVAMWLLYGDDVTSQEYRDLAAEHCSEEMAQLHELRGDGGFSDWLMLSCDEQGAVDSEPGEHKFLSVASKPDKEASVSDQIEHVRMLLKMAYKEALSAQKLFEEEKNTKMVLMRRMSPTFCRDVVTSLKSNFAGTGINPKQIYKLIGLEAKEAKLSSYRDVQKRINELHKTKKITQQQCRQLRYPFMNDAAKEEYDAYIAGTLAQLRCVDGQQQQEIVEDFEKAVRCGMKLADLNRVLGQVEEEERFVGDEQKGGDKLEA